MEASIHASIEGYAVSNFLIVGGILASSAVRVRFIRPRRVLLGALSGTILAAALAWAGRAECTWARVLCPAVSLAVMLGGLKARVWTRALIWIALGTLLTAGAAASAKVWGRVGTPWPAAIASLAAFVLACLWPRGGRGDAQDMPMRIATRMGSAEIVAMIDTGNRLREPLSDLPVLIVSRRCLTRIIDSVCMDERSVLAPGFRMVRYRVLGGGGCMRCFRPEKLSVLRGGRWTDAPDMWVAIYPGSIPGGVDALAPPSVYGSEGAAVQSGRR